MFTRDADWLISELVQNDETCVPSKKAKSIDIDKLGVELELTLLQVTISSMRTPVTSVDKHIKLVSKKFEIKNISFDLGRSLNNNSHLRSLDSLGNIAQQKPQYQ